MSETDSAALRDFAALISAAIAYWPAKLDAKLSAVTGRLGGDCGTSPAAIEARMRELLGLGPACNCVIGGFPLLPASCRVHGIPCETCGGIESCADDCGEGTRHG